MIFFDTGPFLDSWRRLENAIGDAGFNAWQAELKRAAESTTEYHYRNRTGRLTASRQVSYSRASSFYWTGAIRWTASYALWVDEPTKSHPIVPKGEGYPLHFYWEKMGRWVSFWRVQHPGTAGSGFSEHAADNLNGWAPAGIQKRVDTVIQASG